MNKMWNPIDFETVLSIVGVLIIGAIGIYGARRGEARNRMVGSIIAGVILIFFSYFQTGIIGILKWFLLS